MYEPYVKTRLGNISCVVHSTLQSYPDYKTIDGYNMSALPNGYSLSGFKNPRWKDQVRNGGNATTHMSLTAYRGEPPTVEGYSNILRTHPLYGSVGEIRTFGGQVNLVLPGVTTPDAATKALVKNRCIQKYYAAYHSARSACETGQDVGELRATLESIRNPLGGIRKYASNYFTALKKGQRNLGHNRKNLLRHVSHAYLEMRFGVEPLAADITDILLDMTNKRWPQYPFRASARSTYSSSESEQTLSFSLWPTVNGSKITVLRLNDYGLRYTGMINTGAINGDISFLQTHRLLPEDFLPTLWDLLPYSWIADYFTNLGTIIEGLSIGTSNLAWGCVNEIIRSRTTYSNPYIGPTNKIPGWTYESDVQNLTCSNSTYEAIQLNRDILTAPDLMPDFVFKIPHSLRPFINLTALAFGRVRSIHLA
jgi:hypothetical protein